MANNYRNQRDRGEGWFDRTNQYDNGHRYRDQEFGSFRQTGTGDRFRGMNQNQQGRNQQENYNQNSWRSNEDFGNRNERNNSNSSFQNSGMFDQQNDWNDRQWDQSRNNENYRNAQNWGNSRMNSGDNFDRGNNRESWRNQDNNRDRDQDRSWWDKTRDEVSSWFGDDDADRRRRMDEQRESGYKGKGPKEYQRSAERIREDVYDRLSDSDYVDASEVQVKVENNEVILSGMVSSRQQKRMAEDIVESVSGVRHVENRIRVRDNENSGGSIFQNTTADATGMSGRSSENTESGTTNEMIRNVTQRKQ